LSKTILFGGSGFFGPVILKKDKNILSVGRKKPSLELENQHVNLESLDDLSVLDEIDFDKVIFLIGSSNHHEINLKTTMGVDLNLYPLVKILAYLKNRKIKKFICFTTILLYDQKKMILPVNEDQLIDPYINDYVFSKFLSEQIVHFYKDLIPSIIVRLSNIYGYTKLRRPDLVPTIMQDIFSKDNVTIWSDVPKRDFIFTEDAADAVLKLLNVDFTGTLNLGTGKMSSIKDITKIIENLSGKKIISENKDVSGPLEFSTDISKIKKITGWSPQYTLEEGLKKTYNIMKKY
jgi:UDP-glucuronate decarboxylase|tara:strand:+ start:50 stop:922 length:873 start_codon:yes stop_codon:yes gene_type:complete